jgi:carbonic anhydrase
MISAQEALSRLREGNRRFASDLPSEKPFRNQEVRIKLRDNQEPFAVIIGCSDSRVPVETVFDQGLGDLFVVRVIGNIAAPSQIASVEFAVDRLGTPLIVVLGHSGCGAIRATVEELLHPAENPSQNILAVVNRIRPVVEGLLRSELRDDTEALIDEAVRANIHASAEFLRNGSPLIERLVRERGVLIVGAKYCLDTGVVEFFDGMSVGKSL